MTKCILCTAVVESGQKFYDHLEDVHMMPIRRERIVAAGIDKHGEEKALVREETHSECMERFKHTHPEFGTEICWCPECVGGEALARINEVSAKYGQLYISHKGKYK